jgi:SAM-dependent methyltransferase
VIHSDLPPLSGGKSLWIMGRRVAVRVLCVDELWDNNDTALAYARFAAEQPTYRETSRDLVRLAEPGPAATVLDLACGTGATTREILAVLGPAGRVVGVDQSAAMLAQAAGAIDDPRVRLAHGRAEEVDQHVGGPVDAAVCNSAIWQTDLAPTFAAVHRSLAPGGRFVFNIGHPFLTDSPAETRTQGDRADLVASIAAIARAEYGWTPAPAPPRPALSIAGITTLLEQSGYQLAALHHPYYRMRLAEVHAWLKIPIFSEIPLPGLPYEQRTRAIDLACRDLDPEATELAHWAVFVATT